MIAGTRFAAGIALLLAAVVGCTTEAPTFSPGSTDTPASAATPEPSQPSDLGPTVLGMPVVTVDEASRLLFDGKLDGRLVAVFGWWMEGMPMSCPYTPFAPTLSTRCELRAFADQHLQLATYTESSYSWSGGQQRVGLLVPVFVPETSAAIRPGSPVPPTTQNPTPAQRVVVIGHAGDPRLWQCRPQDRQGCGDIFVVDRIAWVEGVDAPLKAGHSEIAPSLSMNDAIAATGADSDQVVSAVLVRGESAGTIDPRVAGTDATAGWVIRVVGSPDEFGTADATTFVVDDKGAAVLAALPLQVAADYAPALLTVYTNDMRTPAGGDWGYTDYSIADSDGVLIRGDAAGVALDPGTYTLRGNITGDVTPPPPGPPCETQVELGANDDIWMRVTFAQDGSCAWAVTQPLP